jgi:glutamate synthase (NADPH) small chain
MSYTPAEELKRAAVKVVAEVEGKELKPKERLALPRQEMPSQDPQVRRGNMNEVAIGYFEEQVKVEAERCLQCKTAPCVAGCPVQIDIPGFIKAAAEGKYAESLAIIKRTSLLPAICGRVCPQESQCQLPCTVGKSLKDVDLAVSIGRIERYVADWADENGAVSIPEIKPETGKKVAIIGTGPASITVAADVRREGHEVHMFEAFHKPGGVMIYGIPEFRLPKRIVAGEIDALKEMGVKLETNYLVGRTRTIRDMMEKDGFEAVFIGTGAGLPKFMNIEGENLVGVFSANEYLTRVNLMKAYDKERSDTPIYQARKVAVLGGGNVAMDAARSAVRMGADEVHIIYRRTEKEMPARVEEVAHAKEEGVQFHLLRSPKRILEGEKGRVRGLELVKFELGEPDDSGRRRPVEVKGSEYEMAFDTVIVAIGNNSNPLIEKTTPGLDTNKWGNIVADENGKTSMDRVFAGGDIVLGAATVILAMGEGRKAAASINELLAK